MMNTATMNTSGCGCAAADPAAVASWSMGKAACGCGCSGCGAASCGKQASGGCGCASGGQAISAPCTSGTAEATQRPGVVVSSCLPPRPRYFPGELISDADLTAAVDYHRAKQQLANSVLSGWGVYCGFALCIDKATCTVCVGPGVAIDAKGRELVSDQSICIARPKTQDIDGRGACDPCAKPADETLYLALVYDDCLDSAKPRYGTACGASQDPGCDFSRVRERARLVWVRDLDQSYYTSGCLPDPCADTEPPDRRCMPEYLQFGDETHLRLDECTPCIGIRGGDGVEMYARALDARWSLSRNAHLIQQDRKGRGNGICGVSTLIDVISGAACEVCSGEAIVVLAKVRWSSGWDNSPTITVEPLRRRVLSNASLTYLVEWLMERALCGPRKTTAVPEQEEPPFRATCEDPCVGEKQLIRDVAEAAVGPDAPESSKTEALAKAAYWVAFERKTTYASFDQATFLDIFRAAYPKGGPEGSEADALHRFHRLVGRVAAQAPVARGIALLFPKGVPAEKQSAVEDEVYSFIQRRNFGEVGSAPFAAVLALANSLNELIGRGLYPTDEAARLAKQFPDARAGTETELALLRAQMEQLEDELARIKAGSGAGTTDATGASTTKKAPLPAASSPAAATAPAPAAKDPANAKEEASELPPPDEPDPAPARPKKGK